MSFVVGHAPGPATKLRPEPRRVLIGDTSGERKGTRLETEVLLRRLDLLSVERGQ